MKVTCPKCHRRIRIRNQREINCLCGYQFSHQKFYGKSDKFLVDTNIFLYAINKDRHFGNACNSLLSIFIGELVTTNHVINEIRQYCEFSMKVYNVDTISPEVAELRYGDESYELSLADKSLIQCAIDNPEIIGIITYDTDIKNVVPNRLIKSEKPFFIGTADALLKKRGKI